MKIDGMNIDGMDINGMKIDGKMACLFRSLSPCALMPELCSCVVGGKYIYLVTSCTALVLDGVLVILC